MMSLTETVCGEKEGDEEEDDRWSVRGGGGVGRNDRSNAKDAYLVGAFGRHVPMGDAEEA